MGKTCGQCPNWRETTIACAGMGYCTHPSAIRTEVRPRVSVGCFFLADTTPCLLLEKGGAAW